MKDDTISRQTAIDAVQGIGRLATLPDNDAVVRMSAVEYVLFNLPSEQPERKKGRWLLDEEGGTCYCSECKEENYYAYDWNTKRYTDNFCPNCGAKMIQKGENNEIN